MNTLQEGWCDACKKAEENPEKKWMRKLKVSKPSRDAVSEFAELPPVLVLHLKRTKGDGTKDKTPISVQMVSNQHCCAVSLMPSLKCTVRQTSQDRR